MVDEDYLQRFREYRGTSYFSPHYFPQSFAKMAEVADGGIRSGKKRFLVVKYK
jgi:hypothetical protein